MRILPQLRRYWRPIVLTRLAFTLLGVALLTPLFGALLQGLVSLSGSAAVADQDIARLLLTPLGMVGGIFLVALVLALSGLEIGAQQFIALAASREMPVTALQATLYSLRHTLPLLRLTLWLTLRVLAYLLPWLAAIGAMAWFLLREHEVIVIEGYFLPNSPSRRQLVNDMKVAGAKVEFRELWECFEVCQGRISAQWERGEISAVQCRGRIEMLRMCWRPREA